MATTHALDGLHFALREESAFRQELLLAALMAPWAFVVDFNTEERILLLGALILVLVIELLNSGIEATVDRISFQRHSLSQRAKDYGSAAVFLALLLCGAIWCALFITHLL
ncbi:MAG: diacylglycerol kinase [Fluviibacter sp.]